jgi:hypothetical protein
VTASAAAPVEGLPLRRAALLAGFGFLLMMGTPFAQNYVNPRLIVDDDIGHTARNILAHQGLFVAGIFGYLINFIGDVVVAWALYALLRPVDAFLSLLTAWFRLVYTVVALCALLNLVTLLHLLNTPAYLEAFGAEELHAQARLLLDSFGYGWGISFAFFAIHLVMLGYLVYRSGYIPKAVGILLALAGLGYLVYNLGPYVVPRADLSFVVVTFFGEAVFLLWLLIKGWKLKEPAARPLA